MFKLRGQPVEQICPTEGGGGGAGERGVESLRCWFFFSFRPICYCYVLASVSFLLLHKSLSTEHSVPVVALGICNRRIRVVSGQGDGSCRRPLVMITDSFLVLPLLTY